MNYEWLSVGDQDSRTRKMCMLGPYKLEHIEDNWISGGTADQWGNPNNIMMMANIVWLCGPIQDEYIEVETNLRYTEYKDNESFKVLEDWYACNVLLEKHFGSEYGEGVQGS